MQVLRRVQSLSFALLKANCLRCSTYQLARLHRKSREKTRKAIRLLPRNLKARFFWSTSSETGEGPAGPCTHTSGRSCKSFKTSHLQSWALTVIPKKDCRRFSTTKRFDGSVSGMAVRQAAQSHSYGM